MSSAGYPMPPRQLLQLFADGLPNNVVFSNIRQYIYISLDETDDHHLPTMEHIYARTRIIDDTSAHLRLRRTDAKPHQSNPPQPSATTTEPKTKPTCGNCGGVHLTKNCFQAGGNATKCSLLGCQGPHRCMLRSQILGTWELSLEQTMMIMKLQTL